MRYHVLATDYDGTLAHHGQVDEPTLAALIRLKQSGRRLVLVTGRELEDLLAIFPQIDLFDRVVAENGVLLYRPADKEEKPLAESPSEAFVTALRQRGVTPLSVGRTIVATEQPHETAVLDVIRELGLEMHVIFNKGAVMVLPSGVNKATGLAVALAELGLSAHNAVGVGDAENDHAFLAKCECAVAVANALPALQERADWVTTGKAGAGVTEVIDQLLADDLAQHTGGLARHRIALGKDADSTEFAIDTHGVSVLVAGTSGSGKSTVTTGWLERLADAGYQFVIIDPEGDYSAFEHTVALGDPQHAPAVEEVLDLLSQPDRNAAINLLGIPLEHRPAFFDSLLPRMLDLREKTGRPHWIVVDEAHHLLPSDWPPAGRPGPPPLTEMLFITVHPESVAPLALHSVGITVAVGENPNGTIAEFCRASQQPAPTLRPTKLETGEVLFWRVGEPPVRVQTERPRTERRRHSRKYAQGSVGPERSFRFRGPKGALNLAAQNLIVFLQMADGVDDDTWEFHRERGEYSAWFTDIIKDPELGAEAARVEQDRTLGPAESRATLRRAVEARYTLPADRSSGEVSSEDTDSTRTM